MIRGGSVFFVGRIALGVLLACVTCGSSAVRGDDNPAADSGGNPQATPRDPQSLRGPLSPADALAAFQVHPLVKVELAAAEPEVIDPVAIRFDEHGRMWVAEMRDYPNGPAAGEQPTSQVRVLEDRDGDGYYEMSRVFADHLLFLTGLQPWKGGAIVTLAGQVAWLADTDGDGAADVRETWFTGFTEDNPQLRANHPTLGMDNHVYVANGLRGGKVIAAKSEWAANAHPVSISGMDFRFDPRSGDYGAVAGNGQFGLTFDELGNRFVCSNRNPCMQVVLEDRYVRRNPYFAVDSVVQDVSAAGEQSRVFPLSRAWTTSNLHAGQFTAACGVTIYNGDLLPAEFRGNSFTCEPTGNLVHRDVLSPTGATFTSHPDREGIEFLATRDEWFRPVNLSVGPDGALYVVDMYRAVIEHPAWMPTELRNRADLLDGNDRGRIYRLVPADAEPPAQRTRRADPLPAERSGADLVRLLEHDNSWHRETAARLIFERADPETLQPLKDLVSSGKSPRGRIHALWALSGLGGLDAAVVAQALDDPDPHVRGQAVRLAEPLLKNNSELCTRCVELIGEADPRLRFQLALSLGESPWNDALRDAFAQIARESADDPWLRKAIVGSAGNHALDLLQRLLNDAGDGAASDGMIEYVAKLATVVAARQDADEIAALLGKLSGANSSGLVKKGLRMRLSALGGLGEGLNRRGKPLQPLIERLNSDDAQILDSVFGAAVETARDRDAALPLRLEALRVLRHARFQTVMPVLESLARENTNQDVRTAAIDSLAAFREPSVGQFLTSGFSAQTPTLRRALLGAIFTDDARIRLLLDEIDAGRISSAEIDLARGNQLLKHREADIRERAARLLAPPVDREKVLAAYKGSLSSKGNGQRGREVFSKNCAICHRIGDVGVNVAPDIGDSRDRTPESLLTDILDPNRAIDSNYFSYTVLMTDGKQHTGVLSTETATSITLRQQEGKMQVLLRNDVDELHSNGVSLMPVGLEKDIPPAQMVDLIAFIKNWRYLDGAIPIELE